MRALKTLGLVVAAVVVVVVLFRAFLWPDVASLKDQNPKTTSFMRSNGRPAQFQWAPLSQISPALQHAVIVAEDGTFYSHHGIDSHELQESLKSNLKSLHPVRGFSTITMQLAKNLYLSQDKTFLRKLREILIALDLERKLGKQRILELYLNVAEWGPNLYGAEAASQHFFQKPASQLTRPEAAFLAAILPNPKRLGKWPPSPYVSRRQETILSRMAARGF